MTDGTVGPETTVTGRAADARFPVSDQIYVSLLWFAFSAQWTTLLSVIIPDQVAGIVGPELAPEGRAERDGVGRRCRGRAGGRAVGRGAVRPQMRSARPRRSFLIAGVVGSCVSLMLMAPFGPGSSLLVYTIAFLNLTFWWNWLAGAYAGLIPDVVPEPDQVSPARWINIMTASAPVLAICWSRPSMRRTIRL